MAIPQSEILKFAKDEDDTVNKNMQSKFNTFVEFVLSSGISMPEAADDFEVVSLDMDEPSENEADIVISAGISEGEIADDIIKEVKKLRKKVGDDSYYRASKILKLAVKLKEMHPTKTVEESFSAEKRLSEFLDKENVSWLRDVPSGLPPIHPIAQKISNNPLIQRYVSTRLHYYGGGDDKHKAAQYWANAAMTNPEQLD